MKVTRNVLYYPITMHDFQCFTMRRARPFTRVTRISTFIIVIETQKINIFLQIINHDLIMTILFLFLVIQRLDRDLNFLSEGLVHKPHFLSHTLGRNSCKKACQTEQPSTYGKTRLSCVNCGSLLACVGHVKRTNQRIASTRGSRYYDLTANV
jgi:hypothetical protein